jgi:hypothetical protein
MLTCQHLSLVEERGRSACSCERTGRRGENVTQTDQSIDLSWDVHTSLGGPGIDLICAHAGLRGIRSVYMSGAWLGTWTRAAVRTPMLACLGSYLIFSAQTPEKIPYARSRSNKLDSRGDRLAHAWSGCHVRSLHYLLLGWQASQVASGQQPTLRRPARLGQRPAGDWIRVFQSPKV